MLARETQVNVIPTASRPYLPYPPAVSPHCVPVPQPASDRVPLAVSLPVAVEPADPYLHRPLPHIISSRQFEDDDSVGLQLGGGPPPADTEDDLTDQVWGGR